MIVDIRHCLVPAILEKKKKKKRRGIWPSKSKKQFLILENRKHDFSYNIF